MSEPVGTELRLTYLGVQARIVVNRHGDRWRAHLQSRHKAGKSYGEWGALRPLVLDDDTPTYPDRLLAIFAAVGTAIETEDGRADGDETDDDPAR